jgi:hypothetical protein
MRPSASTWRRFFCGLFVTAHFLLGLVAAPSRELDLLLISVTGSCCVLLDLWLRGLGVTGRGPLQYLLPGRGGHLGFVPVWALGLSLLVGVGGYAARLAAVAARPTAGQAEGQPRRPSPSQPPTPKKVTADKGP